MYQCLSKEFQEMEEPQENVQEDDDMFEDDAEHNVLEHNGLEHNSADHEEKVSIKRKHEAEINDTALSEESKQSKLSAEEEDSDDGAFCTIVSI